MKDFTARARALMNLILLTTMLLAWTGFHKGHDVMRLGANVYQLAMKTSKTQRPQKLQQFISEVRTYQLQSSDDVQAIGHVRVSDVLSLADIDLIPLFPSTEAKTSATVEFEPQSEIGAILKKLGFRMSLGAEASVLFSPEAERFQRYLDQLDQIFSDSNATEKATMKGLHDRIVPKVEIPFIRQQVPVDLATTLLSLGLVPVYLYFFSICRAMKQESFITRDRGGIDWIFYHPGWLGICLGSFWLVSPSVVVFAGWISLGFQNNLNPILSFLLAVLATQSILSAISVRRTFLLRIQNLSSD